MKACVLHAIGDLRCEDVAKPEPGPGEVLIRIGACGVCGSDIPRVFEKGTYRFPTIPGHEFSGTVEAVGEGVLETWLHRRVAVFPLIPCRECAACETGAYAQCDQYDYLGSRSDGAFAEYVCAPEWNLLQVPDDVSLEAAAMVEPAAVAAHALRQAGIDLGDTVCIFGAGPIGLMLAHWARIWGAGKILLVDVDVEKLRFAKKQGFQHLLDATQSDPVEWVKNKTGHGADVVVEGSGSPKAFEQCMPCARTFGTVVLMGNPAGDMTLSQQAYWEILRKELRLVGTWNSIYADMPRNEWQLSLDAMASGKLDVEPLITHRVILDALPEHLTMMRDRNRFSNKVLYVNPEA